MSKGTKVFLASAGLLTLTMAFMSASPAMARTVSESVAAVDNIAPAPPTGASAIPLGGGVEVSWTASADDGVVRQSPTGGDFTSFGSFINVSDLSGYNVWFKASLDAHFTAIPGEGGGPPTVGPGVTSFADNGAVSGLTYEYRVTAWDGTNDSAPATTNLVSLGPPPALSLTDRGPINLFPVGQFSSAEQSVSIDNQATDPKALLFVTASVTGAGFSVSTVNVTSAASASLTISASGTGSFAVVFSAEAVNNRNGTFHGTLTLGSNDPDADDALVEIVLSANLSGAIDAADIAVDKESLSFGQVLVNGSATRTLNISNNGGVALNVSSISATSGFGVSASDAVIAPGASLPLTVTFSPDAVATVTGTLTIDSDDADQLSIEVSLSGQGVTEISGAGSVQQTVQSAQLTLAVTFVGCDDALLEIIKNTIAAAIMISPSRILLTCASLTPGSTIINFQIIDDPDPDSTEPSAADAAAALATAVADDPAVLADIGLGDASDVTAEAATVSLLPLDANGDPVLGWFNRGAGQAGPVFKVGLDDFFAFGDAFGSSLGGPAFDTKFDIAGPSNGPPDGEVGFDDFFKFGDDFGKVVDNAAEIRALLGIL